MKHLPKAIIALLVSATIAQAAGYLEVRAPGYDFRSAEYTTTHVFVDEVEGDTVDIEILYTLTGFSNITDVEVFTNVNRRDLARIDKNSDGYADGIQLLDGNTITDSPADTDTATGHYYAPLNMTDADFNGIWELTIPAAKTGAYRLTARFKTSDSIAENSFNPNNWIWYGLRDHAVVVSPTDAREIRLYEINVFNIEASGDAFADRSTLEDLHNAAGAAHNSSNRWDLTYLKNLGMNWLWFQPIHPNGIDGREPNDGWGGSGDPYDPGSPYAVKNFFEVNELMSINYNGSNTSAQNRAESMTAFQNFVAAADTEEVGVMLDAPFNHTAFDVELAQAGIDLFQPDGQSWSPTDEIRNRDARFFSLDGNYGNRASSAANIAPGPDRFDFGKWNDVKDVFFGRYDALVEYDSEPERSSYTSEGDWLDTSDSDWTSNDFTQNGTSWNLTRRVWDYFAEYALFWLTQTGYPEGTPTSEETRLIGIDGLRCDFGQGLPPRAWEYIINVARSRKWNFVMMSESLDGGAVTYRSNRHFDILNENITFSLNSANDKSAFRSIFDNRRTAYGQGLVLLNNTSHDEATPSDPWEAVVRTAAVGMMDGTSMIFPGQELGIAGTYGYTHYELNFGKSIPHFKRWNSMMPIWNDGNFGNDQLYPVYSGIQTARKNSPALTSSNRWFLDGDGNNTKIFAAAKYETTNASPAYSDVVLGFVNVDRNNTHSDNFKVPTALAALLGLQDDRTYNVKNIAAYTAQQADRRELWQWGSGITGADLKASGFFVQLNKVPTDNPTWSTAPYEAQYLKVYDVTPPPAPTQPVVSTGKTYVIGNQVIFAWSDSPTNTADDNVTSYKLVIKRVGSDETVYDQNVGDVTEYEYTGSYGDQLYSFVIPISSAGIEGASSVASESVTLLDPDGDADGDGQSNANEDIAGQNPFNASSVFKIIEATTNETDQYTICWVSVSGVTYRIESSTLLSISSWSTEESGIVGTGETVCWTDPVPISGWPLTYKFFRVSTD
ncbi:hypothetical protein [Cerasicoccus arenae]|uniref:Fibronectin type-III domain-containing protein n=1 Tax=Cerasicoccus arenae TaxID=424488 RepID=A0A8J3GE26_9BACT|nr:hypothetical protein [Cerasicoccus arenae]MBK1857208.1 hypothetical protein [Cerasicoccus arenae]GHC00003.1 hypothetical protein GCM10007047_15280 [Cerasicoccus arenae]